MVNLGTVEFKEALVEVPLMKDLFEEEKQEGKKEREREIALNLLKKGIALETIIETTGLSEEEMAKLQKQLEEQAS